ncbi:MAG TPA: M56 family metallopeptidase [Pseudonocardiaceae bacterium]|jgi:hypothetical protein|nr:M56 family metallopeptidase [Pseudonocardiaceae bacterium]
MVLAIYLPLLVPGLAVPLIRWLSDRLHPTWSTWLVTLSAAVLATGTVLALFLLAAAGVLAVPVVARLGHWSAATVRATDARQLPLNIAACPILLVLAVAATAAMIGRIRALAQAGRIARLGPGGSELVVVPDHRPVAHAVPGRPGRIVVSTSMLDLLDPAERRALLAHERAHLSRQHHLFVAVVEVASAANPLLRPLVPVVRYTTERWADELSAGRVGDRAVVARAVGKAALATHNAPSLPSTVLAAATGPVPRRVAALLIGPPTRRPTAVLASPIGLCAVAALLLTGISAVSVLDAAIDLRHVLVLARLYAETSSP